MRCLAVHGERRPQASAHPQVGRRQPCPSVSLGHDLDDMTLRGQPFGRAPPVPLDQEIVERLQHPGDVVRSRLALPPMSLHDACANRFFAAGINRRRPVEVVPASGTSSTEAEPSRHTGLRLVPDDPAKLGDEHLPASGRVSGKFRHRVDGPAQFWNSSGVQEPAPSFAQHPYRHPASLRSVVSSGRHVKRRQVAAQAHRGPALRKRALGLGTCFPPSR